MSITISSEVLGTLSVTVAETTGVLSVSVLATAPAVLSMDLGTPGPSPTITVGTTTTLAPGSPATVTDTGTALAAVFDFGIPQGTTGATGAGVAVGGTTGQALVKVSATDFDTTWATQIEEAPSDGTPYVRQDAGWVQLIIS